MNEYNYVSEQEGINIFESNIVTQFGEVCPKCLSRNIYTRPNFPQWFWGCYDCRYGFWEQYLPNRFKHLYNWVNNLKDNRDFFTVRIKLYLQTNRTISSKIDRKKNIKGGNEGIQLTLF